MDLQQGDGKVFVLRKDMKGIKDEERIADKNVETEKDDNEDSKNDDETQ